MGGSLPKIVAGGAKASVRPRAPKTTKQAELGSLRVACEAGFDMAHQLEFIAGKEGPKPAVTGMENVQSPSPPVGHGQRDISHHTF